MEILSKTVTYLREPTWEHWVRLHLPNINLQDIKYPLTVPLDTAYVLRKAEERTKRVDTAPGATGSQTMDEDMGCGP